VIKTSGKITK